MIPPIPGIRRLWLAQLVSIAGDFLAIFAVLGIASFRMHATPAGITGVSIAYMLPLAVLTPLSGIFVDRWNAKRTMISSDLIRALLILLLTFARQLDEIYAILFAHSVVSTFFLPAQSVMIRTLAPRESLLSVNALLQQTTLVMRLISPAIAGALVGRFGAGPCFYLDSASFAWSACMLSGIAFVRSPGGKPAGTRNALAGIRFIFSHPEISFVTAAMAGATFAISCFSPLLAIFVRDLLHAGIQSFAAISTATGIGLIAGTQAVRLWVKAQSPRRVVVLGLAVVAGGVGLMGASTLTFLTAGGSFLMGAGAGLLTVPAQTLIQSETPLEMIGRVSSGVTSSVAAAQIAGLAGSGTLAGWMGLRPLFFLSASMLAGLVVAGLAKRAGRLCDQQRRVIDNQLCDSSFC